MARLAAIEGLDQDDARRLSERGCTTTEALLTRAADAEGRAALAAEAGVAPARLLEWVRRADLLRVRGIGREYSDLLGLAGITSVTRLARCAPGRLHGRLLVVAREQNLARRPPSINEIVRWVDEAKSLPAIT
jgi:Domain of unknown function (DUF4332)